MKKYNEYSVIDNPADAQDLFAYIVYSRGVGSAFNPDDPVSMYKKYDGTKLFDERESEILENLVEMAYDEFDVEEIYREVLTIINDYDKANTFKYSLLNEKMEQTFASIPDGETIHNAVMMARYLMRKADMDCAVLLAYKGADGDGYEIFLD